MDYPMQYIKPALLLTAALLLAFPALAQPRQPGRHYDPNAVVTVQGQVEKVETRSRPARSALENKPGREVRILSLKTAQGTVLVHLGPAKFLEEQQFAPKVGDTLSVTGSKMNTAKGDVIVAAEVKSGDKTVKLRDAQGTPLWRGKGQGGRQKFLSPAPLPQ